MTVIEQGHLNGSFKGFKNRDTVFQFQKGGTWKQSEYKYQYHYAYRPTARVFEEQGAHWLEGDGMNGSVQVVKLR